MTAVPRRGIVRSPQQRAAVTSWLRHPERANGQPRHPLHLRVGIFAVLPLAVVAMAAAFTLLICDAWFDICLSWGAGDRTTTLVTAVLELPLLALLYSIGHTILRRQVGTGVRRAAVPRVRRQHRECVDHA